EPNTTYTIAAWGKVAEEGMTVGLGVKDHGNSETSKQFTQTEYVNKSITFTTGPSSTSARMYFFSGNDGNVVYADNFSFVLGEEAAVITSAPDVNAPVSRLQMRLYPNPVGDGWLNVERQGTYSGEVELFLFDMTGRLLRTANLREKISTVDVHDLPAGAYTCVLRGGGKIAQQQFIVR
ncbi:MAG: T9SS type A sorting domain-containing protein, partial [Bacteroidota bacterium]